MVRKSVLVDVSLHQMAPPVFVRVRRGIVGILAGVQTVPYLTKLCVSVLRVMRTVNQSAAKPASTMEIRNLMLLETYIVIVQVVTMATDVRNMTHVLK